MSVPACPICRHPDREFISALLKQGVAPRGICRRIGMTTRRTLVWHRNVCLSFTAEEPNERKSA